MKKLYETITDTLVSDGYIIIQNALPQELSHKLLLIAQDKKGYKKAGISGGSSFHIDASKRSDKTKWIDEDKYAQSDYLAFMDGLRVYLNHSLYLGLTYYESHFAIYDKGDFYEKHLDAFKNSKNRVVTTVYYLNEDWNENNGGELTIYDSHNNKLTTVSPKANTLVVFMSDKFPHEVLKASKKRHSIAGWFRVDRSE
ncbi:MAG: 2OG-Fe(II) oxygenase [Sulfurimonas sp.]